MPRKRDEARVGQARVLASDGMSRAGIAAALGVSERTAARWLGRAPGRPVRGEGSRTTRWRRRAEAGSEKLDREDSSKTEVASDD